MKNGVFAKFDYFGGPGTRNCRKGDFAGTSLTIMVEQLEERRTILKSVG
jgi:hypothetical protein